FIGLSSIAIHVRLRYSFCQFHQPTLHSSHALAFVSARCPDTNIERLRVIGSMPASFSPSRYSGRNTGPPCEWKPCLPELYCSFDPRPPTHNGNGCCTGCVVWRIGRGIEKCLPSNVNGSGAVARRRMSISSQNRLHRVFGSTPNATNSSSTEPVPHTRSRRPFDRMSTVDASSATRRGWCRGSKNTFVCSRMCEVRAAMFARIGSCDGDHAS